MATDAQIAANRANAQRSTGPVTAEGKEKVRKNALRDGFTSRDFVVLPGEEDEFHKLHDDLLAEVEPSTPRAVQAFYEYLRGTWNLRRIGRREARLAEEGDMTADDALFAKYDRLQRGRSINLRLQRQAFSQLQQLAREAGGNKRKRLWPDMRVATLDFYARQSWLGDRDFGLLMKRTQSLLDDLYLRSTGGREAASAQSAQADAEDAALRALSEPEFRPGDVDDELEAALDVPVGMYPAVRLRHPGASAPAAPDSTGAGRQPDADTAPPSQAENDASSSSIPDPEPPSEAGSQTLEPHGTHCLETKQSQSPFAVPPALDGATPVNPLPVSR